MITLISGTNRPQNNSSIITQYYLNKLNNLNIPCQLIDLSEFSNDFIIDNLYREPSPEYLNLLTSHLYSSNKIIVVSPEYQGGFPGILKLFIDTWHPTYLKGKKIALTGVSSGRAGNLRGMDHLAAIFMYLQLDVFHNKLPISSIEDLICDQKLTDLNTKQAIQTQLDEFLEY